MTPIPKWFVAWVSVPEWGMRFVSPSSDVARSQDSGTLSKGKPASIAVNPDRAGPF
jgi:hypothetical protein